MTVVVSTVRLKQFMVDACMVVPCHRNPERCHHIKGKPMPICARCLAMLTGFLAIPVLLFYPLPLWLGILMQVPMLVDGITQLKGWRTSTNTLRTVTGLMSGIGLSIGITSIFYFIIALTA